MKKKRWFAILYMFVITFVFTSAVSGLYLANDARIRLNKETRLQGIILQVLDMVPENAEAAGAVARVYNERVARLERDGKTAYLGYAEDGKTLAGVAFPVAGPGFWGPIWGMIGVTPELDRVMGLSFYEHGETPGLGGRISEDWFTDQFVGQPLEKRDRKYPYFDFVQPGTPAGEGEVDAISGATETSTRVERFMNQDLEDMLAWLGGVLKEGSLPRPEPAAAAAANEGAGR